MKQTDDHIRAEELFSAYIDQRTTADERIFVERHVAACAACQAKLEATRAMVTALKAMPPVKAPRSFVLPREMARQPKRSIFQWYPALRLATTLAAIAFVLVFAGDLLTPHPERNMLTMGASAPTMEQQAVAAPTEAPVLAAPAQPTSVPPGDTARVPKATTPLEPTTTLQAPAAAGGINQSAVTGTLTQSQTMSDGIALLTVPTVEATPTQTPETQPEGQGPAQVQARAAEAPTPIDPLRVIEVALGGLVILLGVATLVARRRVV